MNAMVTPQAVTMITTAELLAARRWLSESDSRPDVDAGVIAELPASAVYRALARRYDGGWPQFQRDYQTRARIPVSRAGRGRASRDRAVLAQAGWSR